MRNVDGAVKGADTVVVGGGVIGLAVARELGRRGAGVILIERGELGAESSWAAAGMLAPQVEANAADAFFALASASRDLYPNFARELYEESGVDIELDQTGTLYLAFTEADEEECERRRRWQTRAGLRVEQLTAREVRELEPQVSTRVASALRFPLDGQVENRRLTSALAKACENSGVRLLTQTEVAAIRIGQEERGGAAVAVETARGETYTAAAIVVACGAWSSLLPRGEVAAVQKNGSNDGGAPRIEPVRGQMLCFAPFPMTAAAAPLVRHVVYSPRGYLVPRRDGRLLAGTTTEHAGFDKSLTEAGRQAIMTHACEIAPATAGLTLADAWAGLRPLLQHGADDWPVIGASDDVPNLFYATGHYRNGILLAPLTGALVADMILERGNVPALLKPFAPERFRCAASHRAG